MVCTISKLTQTGATAYYTSMADSLNPEVQATRSAAGYYVDETERGRESTGRWWCSGEILEREFGIKPGSPVLAEDLEALYAGKHVVTGDQFLPEPEEGQTRVRGYDLTFAAPKPVSVMWHMADDQLREKIVQAHEAGVDAALSRVFGERAAQCRTGKDGLGKPVDVDLVIARFTQGDSRPVHLDKNAPAKPGDPHLHTHSVLLAWGRAEDGKYRTLDGRHLYDLQTLAGRVYEAEMAYQLQKLGIEVEPLVQNAHLQPAQKGQPTKKVKLRQAGFGISGMPEELLHHLSKRSSQIEKLAGTEADAYAREKGQKISRSGKDDHQWIDRHAYWQNELESIGYTPERVAEILAIAMPDTPEAIQKQEPNWKAFVPLTVENDAILKQSQMEAIVTSALIGRGFDLDEIETIRAKVIGEHYVNIGKLSEKNDLHDYFTTQAVLDEEKEVARIARTLGRKQVHRLADQAIDDVLKKFDTLGHEQKEMVRIALGTSDLALVEGAAGSGKSYCLLPIAEAYRLAGYRILGASTAWEATGVLKESIDAECLAIAKWKSLWERGKDLPDSRTVLILDEAAMTSRKDAIDMMRFAEQHGCKVILTGDQKQFKPVGSGDPVRLIDEQLPASSKMRIKETRRQRQEADRHAATMLAEGKPEVMIERSKMVSAWHQVETPQDAIERAAELWREKHDKGVDVVVIGGTNAEVVVLSRRIRDQLIDDGLVDPSQGKTVIAVDRAGTSYDLEIAPGDEVRFQKTHKDQGVRNRSRARVLNVDDHGMKFEHVDGKGRGAGAGYISWEELQDDRGRVQLEHGYALTAHASQGLTVDDAIVCLAQGSSSVNRSYAYVVGSRHRARCEWVVNYGSTRKAIRLDEGLDPMADVTDDMVEARIKADFAKEQKKPNAADVLKKSGVNVARMKGHSERLKVEIEGRVQAFQQRMAVGRKAFAIDPGKALRAGRVILDRKQKQVLGQVAAVVPTIRSAIDRLAGAVDRLKQQTAQLVERRLAQAQQIARRLDERQAEQERRDAAAMAAVREHRAARAGRPLHDLIGHANELLLHIDQFRRTHDHRDFLKGMDQAGGLAADPGWRASPANELRQALRNGLETPVSKSIAEHHIVDLSVAVRSLRHRDPDHRAGGMDRIVRELDAVTWRHRPDLEQQKLDRDLQFVLKQSAARGFDLHAEVEKRAAPDGSDLADRLARFAQRHALDLRPATAQELRRQQQRDGQGLGRG